MIFFTRFNGQLIFLELLLVWALLYYLFFLVCVLQLYSICLCIFRVSVIHWFYVKSENVVATSLLQRIDLRI